MLRLCILRDASFCETLMDSSVCVAKKLLQFFQIKDYKIQEIVQYYT